MKGHDIAVLVGPPSKRSKPDNAAEDALDGGADDAEEEGGDEEAEVGAMEEFQGALKDGTPEEALKAYKQLRDTCG
jgi:hypothetical protein